MRLENLSVLVSLKVKKMQVGILQQLNEKQIEERIKERDPLLSVTVDSLLSDIELNLWQHKYDAASVLRQLQQDLLLLQGKLIAKKGG
jgi:hypothetical protein